MTPRLLLALALLAPLAASSARAQDDGSATEDADGGAGAPSTELPTTSGAMGTAIGATRATDLGSMGGLRGGGTQAAREKRRSTAAAAENGLGEGGGGGVGSAGSWSAPHEDQHGSCARVTTTQALDKQPKFRFAEAAIENSPADVAGYAETTRITRLDITKDGFAVDFTKKDGEGRWPDITTPGWGGPLQYTLWMVESIKGAWYASGPIEYWYGLERSGGAPSEVASNWFYDGSRWGPMACHQPRVGERVGFFVTHGDARNNGNGSHPLRERSDIVWIQYPSDAGGVYSF